MTILADLVRGDTRSITVSGLVDENGLPTTFGPTDVVTFTMKKKVSQSDAEALIQKTSEDDGGVVFVDGTDTATITITSEDWDAFPNRDVRYVWDVQIARNATDPPTVVTIAAGEGVVVADTTLTVEIP
jgi:hypothetical protein